MSAIRVNPNPTPDLLEALGELQRLQNTDTLELATGSRINQPSDNPAGAAALVQISNLGSQLDSFEQSVGSITGQLSNADSVLNSVVTALQRAISLGTQGANGTLSDADRADIAAELSGIQSQVLSLANATYQGQFMFAGTANVQPFVVDPNSPSGVTYQGNTGTNKVAIGNGYELQINQPGSQIFNGTGADIFQSLHDIITALQNNSGIPAAVDELGKAYTYLTTQRVFYGNALNQTQAQQNYLDTAKVSLGQQQNTVSAADYAQLATQLSVVQTATSATLAAMGRIPLTSLFDYLK